MNCGEAWHGSTLPEQPAGGAGPHLCDQQRLAQRSALSPRPRGWAGGRGAAEGLQALARFRLCEEILSFLFKVLAQILCPCSVCFQNAAELPLF